MLTDPSYTCVTIPPYIFFELASTITSHSARVVGTIYHTPSDARAP